MNLPELLSWVLTPAFTLWSSPVTWLEILACVLSLWMVERNIRVDPLGWPLAIAASLLYAVLFGSSKLYGEAALQFVFIAVAAWGWREWLRARGGTGRPLRVQRMPAALRWRVVIGTLLAWPLLGLLLARTSDSDVPFLDAAPTVASLAGQWLLARRYVENWPVWLAVNVFSLGLFAYKALWLTLLLYAVFAALSVLGWRTWQRRAALA